MTWIAVAIAVAGAVLNIAKRWECFVLWIVSGAILLNHNAARGDAAQVGIWVLYLVLDAIGLVIWRRKQEAACHRS